jgi:RNA polymerase sigma factor for flagellar operon FliA
VGAAELLVAHRTFDASRGVSFRAYARIRARGAMHDELRAMDLVPRRVRASSKEIAQTKEAMTRTLGREPEVSELAQAVGLDESTLQQRSDPGSLGRRVELEALGRALIAEQPHPDEIAEWNQARERLARGVRKLPERDQILLDLYYGKDLTMREIAEVLSVSVPRVSQLHAAAVARLKAILSEETATSYGT